MLYPRRFLVFFFNDTATTEIYTLSLHDALPICHTHHAQRAPDRSGPAPGGRDARRLRAHRRQRSEEHTSELQSRLHLVCRLLLEKKKVVAKERIKPATYWRDMTVSASLLA